MSVICSKFLVKLALRKQIFLKTQPCKNFVYIDRGNPSQDCSELRKQHLEYTRTLFDCNHQAHVNKFFGKCKSLCVTLQFLLCFILNLRAIRVQAPVCIWRGDLIYRRVSCFTSLGGGGAYIWRGLFLECYGMSLFNKAVLTKYDFSGRRGPLIFSTNWPSCRISSIEWPPRRSNQGFHIVNCCRLH